MVKKMNKIFRPLATITQIAFLSMACLISLPAFSEYKELDHIVAIVDDDVILASELRNRIGSVRDQLKESETPLPPEHVFVQQVLERLIMDSIQVQFGKRSGIRVDDITLNEAMTNIAAESSLTLEEFQQALDLEGMSYAVLREQIRNEILIGRVRQRFVGRRVSITDQDIKNYVDSEYVKDKMSVSYHLANILIPVSGLADANEIKMARNQAKSIIRALKKGKNFQQAAIEFSSGQYNLEGGDLGWRKIGQIPSLFTKVVPDMAKGEVSAPIKSSNGFHILKMLDRRGGNSYMVTQSRVRHMLVKPNIIRTSAEARAILEDLRDQILEEGYPFEDLASTFSEDLASAYKGGDLGWAQADEYTEEFAAAVNTTAYGTVSNPFQTVYGWHILEIMDERKVDKIEEVKGGIARTYLFKRRFEEELQTWLREVRQEAYVDIKI